MARTQNNTKFKTKADFPELVAAESRLAEMQTELAETIPKIAELERLVGESTGSAHIDTQAGKLLVGDQGGVIVQVDARQELASLKEQCEVLTRAVTLQKRVLAQRASDARGEINSSQLPARKSLAKEISDSLESLQQLVEKIEPMRKKFLQDGGSDRTILLPPRVLPGSAGGSAINDWRRRMRSLNLLD